MPRLSHVFLVSLNF